MRMELPKIPGPTEIAPDYRPVIAGCFRAAALRPLLEAKRPVYLLDALTESGLADRLRDDATLLDGLELAFAWLLRHHRTDYVFRHAITAKVFLGRHSPATTSLLPELRVGERKADVVMLNGTSTAFEIKTDRDNTGRLEGQVAAYLRMFDKVVVVAAPDHVDAVRRLVPAAVGVTELTPAFTLRTVRAPVPNAKGIDPATVFDTLRMAEYVEAVRVLRGRVPDARPVELYGACKEEFSKADPLAVHAVMVRLLKARRVLTRQDFDGVPIPLLAAITEGGIPASRWPELICMLAAYRVRAQDAGAFPCLGTSRIFEPAKRSSSPSSRRRQPSKARTSSTSSSL